MAQPSRDRKASKTPQVEHCKQPYEEVSRPHRKTMVNRRCGADGDRNQRTL